jgi:hypothetical protein
MGVCAFGGGHALALLLHEIISQYFCYFDDKFYKCNKN